MRLITRAGLVILIGAGVLAAGGGAPEPLAAWTGTDATASTDAPNGVTADDDGEIWVTAQNTDEIKILLGMGAIETITLPPGSQPHTISFSPDGSYAYISNLGDGNVIVVRAEDRQIVATLSLHTFFTHDTKTSPDGSVLLSANPMSRILTKIAVDEGAESWTPVASLDLGAAINRGPVCVTFRSDGVRAYVSLFGPAGGIAIVDVASMSVVGSLPTIGSVSGCGIVRSNDGRTIFLVSAGGAGHFYRLDTDTDTLTEDTGYGPIGTSVHGLAITANENRAFIAATVDEQVRVLDLHGNEMSAISLDWRQGIRDAPDTIVRLGSNIYVTLRYAGQVARIKAQTGEVEYIYVAPPDTTGGWAVHGIAVRP
jgi:DNA-binding beta-propeller fold protein YncE